MGGGDALRAVLVQADEIRNLHLLVQRLREHVDAASAIGNAALGPRR